MQIYYKKPLLETHSSWQIINEIGPLTTAYTAFFSGELWRGVQLKQSSEFRIVKNNAQQQIYTKEDIC